MKKILFLVITIMMICSSVEAGKRKMEINGHRFSTIKVDSNYIDGLRRTIIRQNIEISTLKDINQQLENQNKFLEKNITGYIIWGWSSAFLIAFLIFFLITVATRRNRKHKQAILELVKKIQDLRHEFNITTRP